MNQGCPGEGADHRTLGWLICPLQRLFSRKSNTPPRLHEHGLWAWGAWPPYVVINRPHALVLDPERSIWEVTRWRMSRLGWRYDKNWKGYIGPSAAAKVVTEPLLFY